MLVRLGRFEAEQGELPPLCMRCGAPAALYKARQLSWQPVWTYFVFGLTFWPVLLLAGLMRKRMRLLAPFCQRHRNYWRRRTAKTALLFLGLLALFVLIAPAILIAAQNRDEENAARILLLLFWLAGVVATIAFLLFRRRSLHATEITDDAIVLTGVAEAFVRQWRAERTN
jgi:hypothetical protein